MRREVTCDAEADAVLRQRNEDLREPSRDVRHLEPKRHRALAQVKLLYAVREQILVAACELRLLSRQRLFWPDSSRGLWETR